MNTEKKFDMWLAGKETYDLLLSDSTYDRFARIFFSLTISIIIISIVFAFNKQNTILLFISIISFITLLNVFLLDLLEEQINQKKITLSLMQTIFSEQMAKAVLIPIILELFLKLINLIFPKILNMPSLFFWVVNVVIFIYTYICLLLPIITLSENSRPAISSIPLIKIILMYIMIYVSTIPLLLVIFLVFICAMSICINYTFLLSIFTLFFAVPLYIISITATVIIYKNLIQINGENKLPHNEN